MSAVRTAYRPVVGQAQALVTIKVAASCRRSIASIDSSVFVKLCLREMSNRAVPRHLTRDELTGAYTVSIPKRRANGPCLHRVARASEPELDKETIDPDTGQGWRPMEWCK